MNVTEIAILAVAGVLLLGVLKKTTSMYVAFVQIGLIAAVIVAVLPQAKELAETLSALTSVQGISGESIKIMFKIFGVLTVGGVVSGICRDNGENAVADVVEIAVKVISVSCALPVFTAVITLATSFFNR